MTVPKLPAHDAKAANNAWRTVRKPDGSEYAVFASESYVDFVKGLRTQRDVVASHDVQLIDHKKDLDAHTSKLSSLESRVSALEDAPVSPFPGSG